MQQTGAGEDSEDEDVVEEESYPAEKKEKMVRISARKV